MKKAMLKKNTLSALIIASAVGVLALIIALIVYFAAVKPAVEKSGKPEDMLEGEYYEDSTSTYMMFPQKSRDDVKSIEIYNSTGRYVLKADVGESYRRFTLGGSSYYIDTAELVRIANDKDRVLEKTESGSAYIVSTSVSKEKLSDYGISADSTNTVSFEADGKSYEFIFGSSKDISYGLSFYVLYKDFDKDTEVFAVYGITVSTEQTQFKIEGEEEIELDSTSVSGVIISATVVNCIKADKNSYHVTTEATDADLSRYGLDAESDPAWVKVTLADGESYKFLIGDLIPTKGGYYAMAEGRKVSTENGEFNVVYIITTSTANTFLSGSEYVISVLLAPYLGNNVSNITEFSLYRRESEGESAKLVVTAGLAGSSTATAANMSFVMNYPTGYSLSENVYSDKVLATLGYVSANNIVGFGKKIHTEEFYTKRGLDLDSERLAAGTDTNYVKIRYTTDALDKLTDESYTVLYFSEKRTDTSGSDYYYVYSPEYDSVGIVYADSGYEFVEYQLADFINTNLYFNYINCTDYFELISPRDGVSVRYTMTGNEKTLKTIVTKAGDDGEPLKRIGYDGKETDGIFEVQYERKLIGTYVTTENFGDFEKFRDLFYVLLTRSLSKDRQDAGLLLSKEPSKTLRVMTTTCDQGISYYKYDSMGNILKDENNKNINVRYLGGCIVCENVNVKTVVDGKEYILELDKAFYDESVGKFFTKIVDSNDKNEKPADASYNSEGDLVVTKYLPAETTGEYKQVLTEYMFYDIYNPVTDASGKTVNQLNQTYLYVVPKTTTYTWRIEIDGTRTLLSEEAQEASAGSYIRIQTVEKLFSDSEKLLSGIEFDREIAN